MQHRVQWKKPSGEIASDCTTPANVQKTSDSTMVSVQQPPNLAPAHAEPVEV